MVASTNGPAVPYGGGSGSGKVGDLLFLSFGDGSVGDFFIPFFSVFGLDTPAFSLSSSSFSMIFSSFRAYSYELRPVSGQGDQP
ncbi:hypothetical protein F3Y22_tig00109972pilonHSYRG00381 [Hibiscus syriacus]|uniref:Uncharacterized protein n=1 Tax=Hibiscus syriacus TaxID=106335 RepID=A0A6A3BQR1_HIBSY|nr:hypothetical protein F3Y22_tig00109972pilonHSYRG00381 [Hibiscus syriacus]